MIAPTDPRAKQIPAELLLQAVAEGWSVKQLAAEAGVDYKVAVKRLRVAKISLPHSRIHKKTCGFEELSGRGEGFDEPERDRLTVFVMSEVERRRILLAKAKVGDPEAIQALKQRYRLTVHTETHA